MGRLHCSTVLITVILVILTIKVKSDDIVSWEEDHFIKELSEEDITDDCKKHGICPNVTNYDTLFVNKYLKNISKFKKYLKKVPDVHTPPGEEQEEFCESKEEKIWPQAAKDKEGKWHYIVNTEENRYQGFLIHRCIESGSKCSSSATFEGFEDTCHQEFYLVFMVYLNTQKRTFSIKKFQVPGCCACKLQKN